MSFFHGLNELDVFYCGVMLCNIYKQIIQFQNWQISNKTYGYNLGYPAKRALPAMLTHGR